MKGSVLGLESRVVGKTARLDGFGLTGDALKVGCLNIFWNTC
jgi:hypothetical protein